MITFWSAVPEEIQRLRIKRLIDVSTEVRMLARYRQFVRQTPAGQLPDEAHIILTLASGLPAAAQQSFCIAFSGCLKEDS